MRRVSYLWSLCICATLILSPISSHAQSAASSPEESPAVAEPAAPTIVTSGSTEPAAANTSAAHEPRIGPGDLIAIKVFGVPELSEELRVNAEGEVVVALIGPVRVGGLTHSEANRVIETRLKEGGFLRDPHVTLFTKEYATQGITVLGEVSKPGVYPMLGVRRLYDLLSLAGGPTPRAGKVVSITRRSAPDKAIDIEISSDPSRSLASNVELFPGDTVVVSRAGLVYVVGSVGRPAAYVMENNGRMTVLEVLALAGGANRTASLNGTRIIRRNGTSLQEIAVALKPILSAKANDVELQPGDILFVPDSKAKNAARRGLESIVQVATALAVYSPL